MLTSSIKNGIETQIFCSHIFTPQTRYLCTFSFFNFFSKISAVVFTKVLQCALVFDLDIQCPTFFGAELSATNHDTKLESLNKSPTSLVESYLDHSSSPPIPLFSISPNRLQSSFSDMNYVLWSIQLEKQGMMSHRFICYVFIWYINCLLYGSLGLD